MEFLTKVRERLVLLFDEYYFNKDKYAAVIPSRWDNMSKKQQHLIILNQTDISLKYFQIFVEELQDVEFNDTPEDHKLLKNIVTDLQTWNDTHIVIKSKHVDILLSRRNKLEKGIDYIAFQVFGCPHSRDIDVAVLVRDHTELTDDINKVKLNEELIQLGYDISRGVDINVLYCENGMVMGCTKGSTEIQNILYLTYEIHIQKYPLFVSGLIDVNIEEKVSIISRTILDNFKLLISKEEYMEERLNKVAAYAGKWNRVQYVLSILDKIPVTVTNITREFFKSLTMKIVQLILLERHIYEYRKYELARKFDTIFPGHYEHIVWLLMRGSDGSYDPDTIKLLFNEFTRIASGIKITEPVWIKLSLNLEQNPTHLPNEIFQEFIKSPLQPTNKFVEGIQSIYPDRNINRFLIPSINGELLPDTVKDKAILIAQRSPEWFKLLNFYKCGKGTGVKKYAGPDWVEYYFNLIRGSIVELMVINSCDFSSLFPIYKKITLGFLVEEIGKAGCLGIAPDLLLLTNNNTSEIIPVEIKCLTGYLSDNRDYRRDILLATKQLESSIKLIGNANSLKMGIIVFVYLNEDGFNVYATSVRF